MEGQLAPLYVAHADALSSHDAVALDRVASGFAGLGLNLLAAEAAAEAAKHHQAAGRRTAAIAATIKADALAAQCEGARTPALDARQSHDLTPRELEIATMAARGLSSKEIAGTASRFCAHRRQHPAPGLCQARGEQEGRPPPSAGTRAQRHPGTV